MAAYVIADITVLNSELYEDYRRQVPAVIEKYGWCVVARLRCWRGSGKQIA